MARSRTAEEPNPNIPSATTPVLMESTLHLMIEGQSQWPPLLYESLLPQWSCYFASIIPWTLKEREGESKQE